MKKFILLCLLTLTSSAQASSSGFSFVEAVCSGMMDFNNEVSKGRLSEEQFVRCSKQKLLDIGDKIVARWMELKDQEDFQVNGLAVLPKDIAESFLQRFGADEEISKESCVLDACISEQTKLSLVEKIRGPKDGLSILCQPSFMEDIGANDFSEWEFIESLKNEIAERGFKDHIFKNPDLAPTYVEFIDGYFKAMDPVSKVYILQKLMNQIEKMLRLAGKDPATASAEELKSIEKVKKILNDEDETRVYITLKILQSGAPIFIKMFQQMQEDIVGETWILDLLKELKHSDPIPHRVFERMIASERRVYFDGKESELRKKPLGLASMAQANVVTGEDKQKHAVKVLQPDVESKFNREKVFVTNLVETSDLPLGFVTRIKNIITGITEELDFNIERQNILNGIIAYEEFSDARNNIHVVSTKESDCKNVLFESLADGESVGSIMEREDPLELLMLHEVLKNFYQKFLTVAFDTRRLGKVPFLFYHGDLHRENVFAKLNEEVLNDLSGRPINDELVKAIRSRVSENGAGYLGKTTMIDLGNAGIIEKEYAGSLTKAIALLGEIDPGEVESALRTKINPKSVEQLMDLVLSIAKPTFMEKVDCHRDLRELYSELVNLYFRVSYDMKIKISKKEYYDDIQMIEEALEDYWKALKPSDEILTQEYDDEQEKNYLAYKELQSFIKALNTNAMSMGVTVLRNAFRNRRLSVSDKLERVFQDLEMNGLSMPTSILFTNKSNQLLSSMLDSIELLLKDGKYPDFQTKTPSEIFNSTMESIRS